MAAPLAEGGLFPEPERIIEVPEVDERTPGQRRQDRQLAAILLGQHPLSVALRGSLPLHPDARRDGERAGDGSPRCGGCVFRQRLHGGARDFPKCTAYPVTRSRVDEHGQRWEWNEYPRASHGAGTDVQAWWPGCLDYVPKRRAGVAGSGAGDGTPQDGTKIRA